jgi:uncharacterized protein
VGGVTSIWTSERSLLMLFGVTTLLVVAMMLLPAPSKEIEEVSPKEITVATLPLSLCSLVAGVTIGFLGAGNFIFVPLLIYVLKVPTRIAIGSSLFVAMMNTSTGFLGKLVTGQIPWMTAIIVVTGAAVGALGGERIHSRISTQALRYVYGAMVALIALRIWISVLGLDA